MPVGADRPGATADGTGVVSSAYRRGPDAATGCGGSSGPISSPTVVACPPPRKTAPKETDRQLRR
jgi:hypothetical protein